MNGTSDNIIVNSCEFTPIYLIQDSGVTQATSYVLTPATQVEQKPVSNLKRFYESSGNLEKSVLLSNTETSKPRILRKTEGGQIGNNLKLASFLVPKTSASTIQNSVPIIQNSPSIIQNSPSIIQNSPSIIQNSPSIIQNSPSIIQNSPSIIQNSAPIIQNNASIIQNSAPIIQNSVPIVQNTTSLVQSNASTVQNKPAQPVNNKLYKPVVATVPAPSQNVGITLNTIPKIDMDRKIVKLTPCDTAPRNFHRRSAPKMKPKEVTPETPKYTSVQLLKLGETYHSLNVLSDDQVKMVNQALNIIKDPEKIPTEPAYDPVTNTRFIYKIVSPKDLKVVGKNKVVVKEERKETKREIRKVELAHFEDEAKVPLGSVTTRSGRKVRLPRQIVSEEAPQKPRKRPGNLVTCLQCSADFNSLYQLQKHHENNPTHIPARVHSNLFHCLLAIVTSSPAETRAKLFIQQLDQLVQKLRALLPCLMKAGDEKLCSIGEDVGRLFGVNPGKYNLNMDALNCVKDKEGYCEHNPSPPKPSPVVNQFSADLNKPSQLWLSKHNEQIANIEVQDDCARINTVQKWPTVSNKLWNIKQKSQKNHVKKMRLASENSETLIDLGREEFNTLNVNESAINVPQKMASLLNNENDTETQNGIKNTQEINFEDTLKKSKGPHIQFHSAHFDIRSSPIKPTSTVFRKFQINPEKIEKLNVQILRPLSLDNKADEITPEITPTSSTSDCTKLDNIFRDELDMTCKDVISNGLSFDSSKNWAISSASNDDQSHDSFMKSNALIEPSLIHVKDDAMDASLPYSNMTPNADMPVLDDTTDNHDNRLTLTQNQSVLNFLETLGNECLTYPEPEIRNTSVDFQLDLFSFNNT